jgi:hypothetical protein
MRTIVSGTRRASGDDEGRARLASDTTAAPGARTSA